jgi:ribosomal protein L11 methyltransferase
VGAYLELTFELGALAPEAAEAACFAHGALAVTFADSRDDPVLEPAPGEVRLWPATRVVALFAGDTPETPSAAALASALGLPAAALMERAVADRAWEREWLKDFHAMRFGAHLWICPRHETPSEPDAVVVRLEPGLAFGTGTHASTALCLEYLDAHAALQVAGRCAIDYGCGSGVLALACAKLGARAVHCFDIDPQALIATHENAQANAVAERVHVHAQAASLPQAADLLLANILAGALCQLAASFAAHLRPGAALVLGGLLDAQAAEVTAAYAPWFDVRRSGTREGWTCLAGLRHASCA